MKNFIILVIAAFLIISGCTPKVDIDAEKTAVRSVIDDLEKAFETNDLELLSKLLSHNADNIFIGTDAAERFVGYDSFIEAQKQFFISVEKGSEITFDDVVLDINKSGDAAWISCLMDWKGKSQEEPFAVEGARMTLVLENQNGTWVIVHIHGSIPVSGQMVQY